MERAESTEGMILGQNCGKPCKTDTLLRKVLIIPGWAVMDQMAIAQMVMEKAATMVNGRGTREDMMDMEDIGAVLMDNGNLLQ